MKINKDDNSKIENQILRAVLNKKFEPELNIKKLVKFIDEKENKKSKGL